MEPPRFRSKLRLYGLNPPDGDMGEVSVRLTLSGTNREMTSWALPGHAPRCTYDSCMPAYAELDLDTLSSNPQIGSGGRFDLTFWHYADVWTFVSVVDNTTQTVSLISPR